MSGRQQVPAVRPSRFHGRRRVQPHPRRLQRGRAGRLPAGQSLLAGLELTPSAIRPASAPKETDHGRHVSSTI